MVASKLSQILELTPSNEILFKGPFEHVVTSYLELRNPLENRVCFKVKTTAPRRYCVRPNSGIVEPNGKVKIAIMLQPMDRESFGERAKHKFMVQSIVIENSGPVSTDDVWASAEPDRIMDSKLRCVFFQPEQAADNQEEQVSDSGEAANKRNNESAASQLTERRSKPDVNVAANHSSSKLGQILTSAEQAIATSTQQTSSTTTRVTSAWPSSWPSSEENPNRNVGRSNVQAQPDGGDKTVESTHNLTTSFLQPMSDDYKIVLVSLAMLFLGVILGKYII